MRGGSNVASHDRFAALSLCVLDRVSEDLLDSLRNGFDGLSSGIAVTVGLDETFHFARNNQNFSRHKFSCSFNRLVNDEF